MEHEERQSEAAGGIDADRQAQIEQLFLHNYNYIIDAVLSDPKLLFGDADNIAQGVARHLSQYSAPLDDESFRTWALEVTKLAADRISKLYKIRDENFWAIRAGVRHVLGYSNALDDYSALTEDICQEILLLVFERLDSLLEPGPAKLSTRLFELSKRHTLDYHVKKVRRRQAAVRARLDKGLGFVLGKGDVVLPGERITQAVN
jgi:hypothetical protein